MTLSLRLGAALLGLLPTLAFAAPPPAVSGLEGKLLPDGEVEIRWDASPDATVTQYRLYHSSESILESEGIYDDFVETEGPENEYIFTELPAVDVLYVTVLAVNADGEESGSFTEEVAVPLTAAAASSSAGPRLEPTSSSAGTSSIPAFTIPDSSSPSSVPATSSASIPQYVAPSDNGKLHLLSAQTVSPTQVRLTMSDAISIAPERAPEAFRIEGPNGHPLGIRELRIEDTMVTIDTETQQSGIVYKITLSEPLQGANGQQLDATNRSAFFTGHAEGAGQPSGDSTVPADVQNLVLRAQAEAGGTYLVTAQWQLNAAPGTVSHLVVRQSLDRGATLANPQTLQADIAGLQIPGVHPGAYGLAINVVNAAGVSSPGVFESIVLPGKGATVPPPVGSVTPPVTTPPTTTTPPPIVIPGTGKGLPDSGAGALAILAGMGGGMLGWRRMRRGKN